MKKSASILLFFSMLTAFSATGSEVCENGRVLDDAGKNQYFNTLNSLSGSLAFVAKDITQKYTSEFSEPINTCELSKIISNNNKAQQAYLIVKSEFSKEACTTFDEQCLENRLTEYKSLINAIEFD